MEIFGETGDVRPYIEDVSFVKLRMSRNMIVSVRSTPCDSAVDVSADSKRRAPGLTSR